jgi:cyclophilin family peptidyl-prolyl cis-trans isomerase
MKTLFPHRQTGLAVLLALIFVLTTAQVSLAAREPPFALPKKSELLKLRTAVVSTSRGDIFIELFPDVAPWHIANLKYLADRNIFHNTRFTYVYPNYIVQGGGKLATGKDPLNYYLPAEFSDLKHEEGIVGMARKADIINPERLSSPTQFHILLRTARSMDGAYTIIGRVFRGMDVVRSLKQGDSIRDLKVFVRN